MPEAEDSTGDPTPSPAPARYRPARANFSTDVPFDHLHRAARRAELAEAGLGAAAAIAYEWDLESDRVSWGGDWSAFAGAGITAPPTTGKALSAAVAAADRQHRYEAMFGTEFADNGDGIAFQLQFRLEGGDVIAEEGRWYTAENGSPHLARGLLRRLAAPKTANSKSPARTPKSAEPAGEDPILSRTGLAAALGREIGQLFQGQHVDSDVFALGFGRGAGVARGDEDLLDARVLGHFPGQGVFTTAAADNEYVH